MNDFGKRLKVLRDKRKLSVSVIAEAVGVSPSTYREWEYGRSIKGEPYVTLAEILEVSLTELLTGVTPSVTSELEAIEISIRSIRAKL